MNRIRLVVRWSAPLWLIGHGLVMISALTPLVGTPRGDKLFALSLMIRVLAGIGGLLFAWWLMKLAENAELETAARRIHLSIWMLPVPTIILATLPDSLPWIFLALLGMVVLVWCWFVLLMALAVLEMQRHVIWALRLAVDAPSREQRVAQTRDVLQREVDARVRPVK